MMHNASFVVTVKSLRDRKAIREFNHSRVGRQSQTTVLLPFDTEYQFTFKVLDDARRRVNITIDGTTVADDLVLSPGESSLERFLDNNRHFLFARLSHPGVADPASGENGRVEIKVWKEKPRPYIPPMTPRPEPEWLDLEDDSCFCRDARFKFGDVPLGAPVTCDSLSSYTYTNAPRDRPRSRGLMAPVGEAGATVEGSVSQQGFGTTTWRGDADSEPDVFVIHLRGRSEADTEATCSTCGTTSPLGSRFCCNCGRRL